MFFILKGDIYPHSQQTICSMRYDIWTLIRQRKQTNKKIKNKNNKMKWILDTTPSVVVITTISPSLILKPI